MKKIALSVSLEDNELFDAEVMQAIKAQARQIAREVIDQELNKEIERVIDARVKELVDGASWHPVHAKIIASLAREVTPNINYNDYMLTDLIQRRIEEAVDKQLSSAHRVDLYVKEAVSRIVERLLKHE